MEQQLKELAQFKGIGNTSLITLIIPPNTNL